MPQNWKKYTVKELIDQKIIDKPIDGNHGEIHPKGNDFVELGIPFIMATDISNGQVNLKNCKFISRKQGDSLRKGFAKEGDVLLTHKASIGRTAIVPKSEYDYIMLTPQVTYYRVLNKEKLNNQYLMYYFNSTGFQCDINMRAGSGSTRAYIGITDQQRLEIVLPPIPEQRAIASILSALDDKIELNLQMNKTLEEMAMALYKHWFVDFGPFKDDEFVESELGMIPKGWEVKSLNSLCEFSNGYAFKSTDLLKNEEEDCYHVFKMGHILKGGGLKSEGTKSWIKKDKCVKIEKNILKIGDILMSMTDMKDNMTILGHTALMNENNKFIVNQRVGLIRMKNNIEIDYPYIYITTNNKEYIEKLRSQANSGVQVNLSTDAIKNSKILAPSIDVNRAFNVIVMPLFEKLNQNSIENQSLKEQRDSLLPKLISGEITLKKLDEIN